MLHRPVAQKLVVSLGRMRMFGSLFLVGLSIRSIGYPTVFSKAGVQLPFAGDAFYHLRRIWYTVHRFPETLAFDRYASFPNGAQIHWPPAFDWAIAALIRPFVDPDDQAAVEAMAVWVPALLGAMVTGVVGLFATRFYGRAAGWCAGLLYSVLPINFIYSQLGMIDHHVAVALFTTAMLWLACEIFRLAGRADSLAAATTMPGVRLASLLGLSTAATILMWPGSLLHAGVLQLAFGLRWLMADERDAARARGMEFLFFQLFAAACLAPFALGTVWREFGALSPLVLSSFQPIFFAMAAAGVFVVELAHEHSVLGDTRGRRFASGIAIALVFAGGTLVASPALREAVLFAGGWFTHGEELLGLINEMKPLFARTGSFDLAFPVRGFSAALLVLPLVWAHLVWRAWLERSAPKLLILYWAFAFIGLTLQQWRFGNSLAVVHTVLIGAALGEWICSLRERMRSRPLRLAMEALFVSGIAIWSSTAFYDFYGPWVRKNIAAFSDDELRARGPLPPAARIFDVAGRWLGQHTPETAGYLDSRLQPEYGVLATWAKGHVLRYRAERPMVQDNFGPYAGRASFLAARDYFAESDETAAIEMLEKLGVRYVVADATGASSIQGLAADAMARRLGMAFGSYTPRRWGGPAPGLTRHRLIFHAHSVPPGPKPVALRVPSPFRSLGVWEVVPGARIEGNAEPGERIRLKVGLQTSSRATHVYRRETFADEQGRYRFVVPYSTVGRSSPDVRLERAYRIWSPDGETELVVREEDVQSGAFVQGPDL